MQTITLETIQAGRLVENGHMNFGKDGSGWPMQHTTLPRLSAVDRYYKGKAREKAGVWAERWWLVDGQRVADLDEAVTKLNQPPTFTAAEQAFLDMVPVEWTKLHPFLRSMAQYVAEPDTAYGLLLAVRAKGAVENQRDQQSGKPCVRRTSDEAVQP